MKEISKKKWFMGGVVAVIVIVILIAIFADGTSHQDRFAGESKRERRNKKDQIEQVVDQSDLTVVRKMTPFSEGEFTYSFDGIEWVLRPSGTGERVAGTYVGFSFKNFTRREGGMPVQFARPFAVGNFRGDCVGVDEITRTEGEKLDGTPIALLRCSNEDSVHNIALVQQQDSLKHLIVYGWVEGLDAGVIRLIDLTTIVR